MTIAELETKRKEKCKEADILVAEYKKKFGVDYTHSMFFKNRTIDEDIAELKDCIENNHLQSNEPLEDYNPNYQY
jgi:hypothetical protein